MSVVIPQWQISVSFHEFSYKIVQIKMFILLMWIQGDYSLTWSDPIYKSNKYV